MAIKNIDISKLLTSAKQLKKITEDDLPRAWSRRDLVDLIVYILENLKVTK